LGCDDAPPNNGDVAGHRGEACYMASLGIARSTHRKHRVLRALDLNVR
jgi:hypothetical protein